MSAPLDALRLETKRNQLLFNNQTLSLNRHWLEFFGLLCLHKLEGLDWISPVEVGQLPSWVGVQLKSIGKSVFKKVKELEAAGIVLVQSPPSEGTKRFAIRESLDCEVDAPVTKLRAWLGLTPKLVMVSSLGQPELMRLLLLASNSFERGHHPDVVQRVQTILGQRPDGNLELRAMALLAWSLLFSASKQEAESAVTALRARLREIRLEESSTGVLAISDDVEALVWIQSARFAWRYGTTREIKTLYGRAAKMLQPHHHREWGAIHVGRGTLARNAGLHFEELAEYKLAIEQYTLGNWLWAVGCQLENITSATLTLAQKERDRPQAIAYLEETVRLCKESLVVTDQLDYSVSNAGEINLACALRLLGRLFESDEWLSRAERLAHNSEWDRALTMQERAQWLLASGQTAEAIAKLEESVQVFSKVGDTQWVADLNRTLHDWKSTVLKSTALKLSA